MKFSALICIAILTLSASSLAWSETDAVSATAEQTPAKQKKKKDKVECKRVTVTGSHFKKKVCLKQSRWAEIQRESREAADRMRDQASSGLSE